MIMFMLGLLAGFAVTLVLCALLVRSLMSACGELTRDMSETIERLRKEVNDLKQEKPLIPGWDKNPDRWRFWN